MSGSIAPLFQRLTQGVYVVGVAHGGVRNAFTAAWVMQVSFDPLLLTLSINPHHSSYRLLKEGRRALRPAGPRRQIGWDRVDDGPHGPPFAA